MAVEALAAFVGGGANLHSSAHAARSAIGASPDVSVGHVMFQMVVALGVVVGGIWGFAKIMGRGARRKSTAKAGLPAPLNVLSRQSLGKGLSIAAVQWGGREVLVGISGTTITFLNDARGEGPPFADTPPALGPAPTTASDGAASESTAALAVALRGAPVAKRSLIEQLREATVRV